MNLHGWHAVTDHLRVANVAQLMLFHTIVARD